MDRRSFLLSATQTGIILGGFQLGVIESMAQGKLSLSDNQLLLCPTFLPGTKSKSLLRILNLKDQSYNDIEVPIRKAHVVAEHPHNLNEIYLTKRNGQKIVKINKLEMKVSQVIDIGPDRFSYGHPFFLSKDLFLNPEFNLSEMGEGILSVRRCDNLKEIDRIPSFGKIPHQMVPTSAPNVIAISNLGEMPSNGKILNSNIAFVDIKKNKLIKKIQSKRKNETFTHVHSYGNQIAVSAFQWTLQKKLSLKKYWEQFAKDQFKLSDYHFGPSPIYIIDDQFNVKELKNPNVDSLMVRTNGIHIDSINNHIVATHQIGNCVTFWDSKTFKLKKYFTKAGAEYVDVLGFHDNKYYVVAGKKGTLSIFDSKSLKVIANLSSHFPTHVDHISLMQKS